MIETIDSEYRTEVFRWAAARIRLEFSDDSWVAFWQTTVAGRPIASVAEQLGRSAGSVYTARSRIMRRLRQEVQSFDPHLRPADPTPATPEAL